MKWFKLLVFLVSFLFCLNALGFPVVLGGDSNTRANYLIAPVAAGIYPQCNLIGSQRTAWVYKGNSMIYMASQANEGYPGRGITYLGARLPSVIKSTKAKVCVLNIGANDMWVAVNPVSKRVPISDAVAIQRAKEWCALADYIESLGCEVVAVMPVTPRNASRPLSILRAKISNWAHVNDRVLLDLSGCSNDGVHFYATSAGYGEVSRRYINAVKLTHTWNGNTPIPPIPPEPPIPPITNITTTIVLENFRYSNGVMIPPSGPNNWLASSTGPRYDYGRWICDFYADNGMILSASWGIGAPVVPSISGKQCAWSQFIVNYKLDSRLRKYGWRYISGNKYNLSTWPR